MPGVAELQLSSRVRGLMVELMGLFSNPITRFSEGNATTNTDPDPDR